MIRVLVVDDSAFMRNMLSMMIAADPDMEVVGTAQDGQDGFRKTLQLKPDLITLDIEMPGINGLDCIKLIMAERPTPILVVSSLTTQGALTTLQALSLGALDFIPKSQSAGSPNVSGMETQLLQKIRAIAGRSVSRSFFTQPSKSNSQSLLAGEDTDTFDLSGADLACVTFAASTGGPPVVQTILNSLPADFQQPILVAQHMPREYTHTFARRLDGSSRISVKEAENGDILSAGTAYIGRGGEHLTLRQQGTRIHIHSGPDPAELLYHPSADIMFGSASEIFGSRVLGIILTGMGRDGLQGLRKLKSRAGIVLAQSEASCVVYGMPKAIVDGGLADGVLSIDGLIRSMKTINRV